MPERTLNRCICNTRHTGLVDSVYHHLSEANAPVGMGYVPCQKWNHIYESCQALQIGTIFPELNLPFCGKGGKCR